MLQLGTELVSCADGRVHARVEDRKARLSIRLRHVHRDVGVADNLLRVATGVAGAGDPDAGGDGHGLAAEHVRHPEVAHEPFRHGARAPQVGQIAGKDGELVATQPCDEVTLPDEPPDSIGDRDEELVSGGVTHAVVDDLEVVEVDEKHGRDAFRAGLAGRLRFQRPLERSLEHAPIRGAGEGVLLREILHVPQEHRVPKVQRRHRRELAEHRCDSALNAEHGP